MPLPAIGAAAARAGAIAGRAGAKTGQAAAKTGRAAQPKKPIGIQSDMAQVPQISLSRLFTVEGFMMLTAAGLVDLLGLIDAIPIIGTVLSYLVDIVGILLIGGWVMFFQQGGKPAVAGGRGGGKMAKWFVRGGCVVGELIPVVGALPFWLGLVLFELITSD